MYKSQAYRTWWIVDAVSCWGANVSFEWSDGHNSSAVFRWVGPTAFSSSCSLVRVLPYGPRPVTASICSLLESLYPCFLEDPSCSFGKKNFCSQLLEGILWYFGYAALLELLMSQEFWAAINQPFGHFPTDHTSKVLSLPPKGSQTNVAFYTNQRWKFLEFEEHPSWLWS